MKEYIVDTLFYVHFFLSNITLIRMVRHWCDRKSESCEEGQGLAIAFCLVNLHLLMPGV